LKKKGRRKTVTNHVAEFGPLDRFDGLETMKAFFITTRNSESYSLTFLGKVKEYVSTNK
jgi:hypothetical protein